MTASPDWTRPDRPYAIAHRGASAYAPDNTLEAFRIASALGAEIWEVDIRISSDGQIIAFHLRTKDEWLLNAVPSRLKLGAEGFEGGEDGEAGHFLINGKDAAQANKMVMKPGDKVILKTPGGGGYGAAS